METEAEKQQHRQEVTRIKEKLANLSPNDATDKLLFTLYTAKTDRFLAENEKIWVTGRIFIPVSLAAFAAWAALKPASWQQVFVLGVLSISLLVIWHIVAQAHKRFQIHHEAWLDAIEELKKIDVALPESRSLSIESMRGWLIGIVAFIWIVIFILTPVGPAK